MRQLGPKLLLLGVSLILVTSLSEFLIRAVLPQDMGIWRTTRDGLITLRPDIDAYVPTFDQHVRTNALGFRDEPRTIEPEPGVFRIVLLGDSFMEAIHVAAVNSLPRLLSERLTAAAGRPVEIVNAGVSGWGTDDQLTWFQRVGRNLKPDLVLVAMTLHNDVSDNLAFRFHEIERGRLRTRPREEMPFHRFVELEMKGWLVFHSHLYRLVTNRLKSGRVDRGEIALSTHVISLFEAPSDRLELGWQITEILLDELEKEASSVGAPIVVFLIPLQIQVTKAGFAKFLDRRELTSEIVRPEAPQQRVLAWGDRSGVPVIDLLPAFRAHLREHPGMMYLPIDGHWTEAGHLLAAKTVTEELMTRALIPSLSRNPALPSERAEGSRGRPNRQ